MSIEISCHFGVASFKEISLKSDFIQSFHDLLHVYNQTAPRGKSFDVNRNVLSFHSFAANLKKMALKSDFIQFFS